MKVSVRDMFFRIVSTEFIIKSLWIYFIFKSIYFAISIPQGISPDEGFHFRQILNHYNSPGIFLDINDLRGLFGRQYVNNFFYHWFFGKILHLNFFGIENILFVRLANLSFGFIFLIYSNKLFNLFFDKNEKYLRVFFNVLLTNTIMLTFLFGMVTYDNLVNCVSVFTIYHLVKFKRNKQVYHILISIPILVIGMLSKISFYAFGFISTVLFIYLSIRYFKKINFLNLLEKNLGITLVALFFILAGSCDLGNRYTKYGKWNVNCLDLYSESYCYESDGIFARNEKLKLKSNPDKLKYKNYIQYLPFWFKSIFTKIFEIRSHSHYYNNSLSKLIICCILLIPCCFGLFARTNSGFRLISFFLMTYIFVLSYNANYKTYLMSSLPNLALQGRYIFPVFVIILIVSVRGFKMLISRFRQNIKILIVLTLTVFVVWQEFPSFMRSFNYISLTDNNQRRLNRKNKTKWQSKKEVHLSVENTVGKEVKGIIFEVTQKYSSSTIRVRIEANEVSQYAIGEVNRNSILVIKFDNKIRESILNGAQTKIYLEDPKEIELLNFKSKVYAEFIK